MSKVFEGVLQGKGLKFAVVVARFNEFITGKLLEGAQDAMKRHGVDDVDIAWAPGSFEILWLLKSWLKLKNMMLSSASGQLSAVRHRILNMSPPKFQKVLPKSGWIPAYPSPTVSSPQTIWNRQLNGREPKQATVASMPL